MGRWSERRGSEEAKVVAATATQHEAPNGMGDGAGGALELTGGCVTQPRVRGTHSLTNLLRQQPPLDVEVHAPRTLLSSPLPFSNPLTPRFQRHSSPPRAPPRLRPLPPSPRSPRLFLSPYALALLQPQDSEFCRRRASAFGDVQDTRSGARARVCAVLLRGRCGVDRLHAH